ncbi:MAG: hypothetical protein G01um101429_605 [Parcubacteria group bacterium Gr01-1014_29]|nr:MAG: hypothetical protein G01um101429_605 [Parcubacteria group bacterium Gr01-1014_29]
MRIENRKSKILGYICISLLAVAIAAYAENEIPTSPTLGDIIRVVWNDAIRPAIIFLFILATVVFIWGLIESIISADSEEGITRGKRNMMWGVIGMAIMFATGAIMTIIDNFFKSL